MKKCIGCKLEKSLEDFYNCPTGRDKKQSYCKKCSNINVREYYTKHPTRSREDYLKIIDRHPGYRIKKARSNRDWYKNLTFSQRDKLKERKHLYYLKNKVRYDERSRLYRNKKRLQRQGVSL